MFTWIQNNWQGGALGFTGGMPVCFISSELFDYSISLLGAAISAAVVTAVGVFVSHHCKEFLNRKKKKENGKESSNN